MILVKRGIISVLAVIVIGVLLLGANFTSYVRTTAHSVQDAVQESVPIEFELRRARDLIDTILPDLHAQVRMIAQEEVEIATLESDINHNLARLEGERTTLARLRDTMQVQQVSYQVGNREVSRSQLTEQLHQRFERFKQGELTVKSKQRLLQQRKKSLGAALAMLEKSRHRKVELEQKVESLAAENRLVKTAKMEGGCKIDGSHLSEADQLLSQIQKRLDVSQRVLAHEADIESSNFDSEVVVDWVDEQQVLSEVDAYFDESEDLSETIPRLAER